MAKWLSKEEQEAWRALLAMNTLVFDHLDQQLQQDAGMPHAYYMVLAMLSETPEQSMRMSDLAAVTNSSPSRISHAVNRLEDKGWVKRVMAKDDKRSTIAKLTSKGQKALVAAAPGHVDAVREAVFNNLSPAQIKQLSVIARKVTSALS